MTTDIIAAHAAAEDVFDDVLTRVRDDQWEWPTACSEWTVRDIAAHATWGCDLVRECASGREIEVRGAGPGAARPRDYVTGDPVVAFRAARQGCDTVLDEAALAVLAPAFVRRVNPSVTLGDFLGNLVCDLITHAWDIGDAIGHRVSVDPAVLAVAQAATRDIPRRPGLFDPEVPPPADADDLTRYVAHLGRTSVQGRS